MTTQETADGSIWRPGRRPDGTFSWRVVELFKSAIFSGTLIQKNMTQKTTIRTLLLALAAVLGFTASAAAQTTGASTPAPSTEIGKGLLGQTYVGLGYGYTDLNHSSVNYQGLTFSYNQPLNTGFDLNLKVGDAWSPQYSGVRTRQQSFEAAAVAFIPDRAWGRPFISVGAGWLWTKTAGMSDNSFLYSLDTGVEFQATRELSITPYMSYTDATSLHVNNKWGYGVKAHYWLTDQWGIIGALGRDNKANMTYSTGVTFRF